jgi:hypothetical protein
VFDPQNAPQTKTTTDEEKAKRNAELRAKRNRETSEARNLRLRIVRERYAERKRKKTQEENIQDQAAQAKRKRNVRQQKLPERREERRRIDKDFHQIRRAANEVEADHARRSVK